MIDRLLWTSRAALAAAFCLTVPAGAQDDGGEAVEAPRAKPETQGLQVTLSDFGAEDLAYLTVPQQRPRGGVVIVHDRWGLDDHIKSLTDAFARQGFVAVAVDVYNGQKTSNPDRATELAGDVRMASAARTVLAGARLLKTSPKLRVPHVAVIGYGIGAPLALRAAAGQQQDLIDAVVLVEGPLENNREIVRRLDQPVLGIYGTRRQESPPHTVAIFDQLLQEEGVPRRVMRYNVGGAFTDPRSGEYSPEATQQAWKEMNSFLAQRLDRPPDEPGIMDKLEDGFDNTLDSMKNILP